MNGASSLLGATYVQRASTGRRRECPGEDSDSNDFGRPYRDRRLPDRREYPGGGYMSRDGRPSGRERCPGGGPLMEMEGPLEEDTLMEEGPRKRRTPDGGGPPNGGKPPMEEDP